MKNILKYIFACLLVLVFTGYYVAGNSFRHMHLVDGELIEHSHPHSSQDHQHSDSGVILLQMFSNMVALETSNLSFSFFETLLTKVGFSSACEWVSKQAKSHKFLRAPPGYGL